MFILIASAVAAANGAPALATDGVALRGPTIKIDKGTREENEAMLAVLSTAGSGVMTATARVWGYQSDIAKWFLFQNLNAGSAIAETGTDLINYAERVTGIRHFDRIYVELTALAGTTPAFSFYLFLRQAKPGTN